MNFLLIIDHPNKKSFNYALLDCFIAGIRNNKHQVEICDLRKDKFDPAMVLEDLEKYPGGGSTDTSVIRYQNKISKADYLVFFFPIWWGIMPARLKGWFDKVLLPSFAFTNEQTPKPLLNSNKKAMIFTTTGVSDQDFQDEYGDAFRSIFCKATLGFCGIQDCQWFNFGDVGFASEDKYEEWKSFVKDFAEKL